MNTIEVLTQAQTEAQTDDLMTNNERAELAQHVINCYTQNPARSVDALVNMQNPVPRFDALLDVLSAFSICTRCQNESQQTQIMDVITDCRHLADREKLPWDDVTSGNSGRPIGEFLKALHDLSVSEHLDWESIMRESAHNHACEVIEEADTSTEMIRGWNLEVCCNAVNQAQWRRDGVGMYASQRVSPKKFPQVKQQLLHRAKRKIAAMAKVAQMNPEKIRAIREAVAAANGISADQVIDRESVTIPDTAIEALMDHSGLSDVDRMILCEENDGYRDAIQDLLCAEALDPTNVGQ